MSRYENAKMYLKEKKRDFKPIVKVQEQKAHMHQLSFEMTLPHCSRKNSPIQLQQ